MTIDANQNSMIFMKVGRHAGETLEEIIERKMEEYTKAGQVFWGYGGGTMHPISRVQPFLQSRIEQGEKIRLVMESIVSKHPDTEVFATEYSRDGVTWEPIPDGVKVRGSRYALVLGELQTEDLMVDLARYQVATGPSTGRPAADYIKGRVDKGCLELNPSPSIHLPSKEVHVTLSAEVQQPYAVLLRASGRK